MTYVPRTPFRRPVEAGLLAHETAAQAPLPPKGVNKWEVLREIAAARVALGVSDRAVGVLQTLLSFHPSTALGGNDHDLIVYPSNAAISERANGMPESTLRRHLAALVSAGLIVRRDSPNGKRFARRYDGEKEAFGFDLSPLVHRYDEFCRMAEAIRAQTERLERLRRTVSLMRRDLASLASYGAETRPDRRSLWQELNELAQSVSQALRRVPVWDEMEALERALDAALKTASALLEPCSETDAKIMVAKDVHSERHYQTSNTDSYALEPCLESKGAPVEAEASETADREAGSEAIDEGPVPDSGDTIRDLDDAPLPRLPLGLVLKACPEFLAMSPNRIGHWHHFVRAADVLRPQMGISPSAWDEACRVMGPENAAVVLAAMLERFEEISTPGGYLRHLTRKAAEDAFSPGPMVMALLNRPDGGSSQL
ncbi:replication initiation protein [Alphaproteobacteria bacterium GH1-50]|uniref:Replication initiation protein n=1 Tax=Kangsaoukella pontilimi TaxID=2691042 RepID=A0A7C9MM10_9RHOB|nr:plasmid replication protein RepC [Kangsaoukella pontilimi]MXQ09715.1 replication initiation protein [Kangsaoukella pontilimi]